MIVSEDHNLHLVFQDKSVEIKVRRFNVHESLAQPFRIAITGIAKDHTIDLEKLVGRPASFVIRSGIREASKPDRLWTGVCNHIELVRTEAGGASTFFVSIVPALWLLSQRRGHRIFQRKSVSTIVKDILDEWRIKHEFRLKEEYLHYDYVVQYGESDLHFISRLLEHEGITYRFEFDGDSKETLVVFDDAPQDVGPRDIPLEWVEVPPTGIERQFITNVRTSQEIRPGKYTIREFDFRRRTDFRFLESSEPSAPPPEDFYDQYHYVPVESLRIEGAAGDTPHADDKGAARQDPKRTARDAFVGLRAGRTLRRKLRFETNCVDVTPGVVFAITSHPRAELRSSQKFLTTDVVIDGGADKEWTFWGIAAFQNYHYRPPRRAKKPRIAGLQTAVVVGQPGQEIHTDEFGRVRVQFHWDRVGRFNDGSSCWARVSQQWAGAGFGTITTPRVGQEVIVSFLEGDPDLPMVVGRVFDLVNPVPYPLPEHDTKSTWRSHSTVKWEGNNEITFEDRKSQELVYMQAQRDLQKLTKREETERIGGSRAVVVGKSRSAIVKTVDATLVGTSYALQMIKPPGSRDLRIAEQDPPNVSPLATTIEMKDSSVLFTTGKATLALVKDSMFLHASGDVKIHAESGDVILEGKKTFLNSMGPASPPGPGALEDVPPGVWKPTQSKKPESVHQKMDANIGKRNVSEALVPKKLPTPDDKLPKQIVCKLLADTVACSHGRTPNDKGVLEVVADSAAAGDQITCKGDFVGGCGNHPEWSVSGSWQSNTKAASTEFRARGWMEGTPLRWLGQIAPKSYGVEARACSGAGRRYDVRCYPNDAISLSLKPFEYGWCKEVLDLLCWFFKLFVPSFPDSLLPKGPGLAVKAQWKEWKDWRAWYRYEVTIGFEPLVALPSDMRFKFGPGAFLPAIVKKYIDPPGFYVRPIGELHVRGHWRKVNPDERDTFLSASGYAGAAVGANLSIASGKVIDVTAEGEGKFELTGQTAEQSDEPAFKVTLAFLGLRATFTLKFWNGRVQISKAVTVIPGRTILPATTKQVLHHI